MLVRESVAPPPLAAPTEPSAGAAAATAISDASSSPGPTLSLISMDDDIDMSPEARQCTAALREGKRCVSPPANLRQAVPMSGVPGRPRAGALLEARERAVSAACGRACWATACVAIG